ncbi:hypothetical protein WR25_02957 isoform C [Diploscapter pachys]|uniref:Uncharacterized protein n=1 Tax=Diploscapter pachys TaxID=2018661 RepID=A0A2A2JRK1_9BILA|nr:hypothetical protein WR25_02957 isoform C [Diploscapter pachys]
MLHESGEEVNKFILLLLGCAIQGNKKKAFIERITKLDGPLQKGIADHIQRITDTSSVVLSLTDSCSERHQDVVWHLEKVMKERDTLQQTLMHVTTEQESDEGSSTTATSSVNGDAPPRRREVVYDQRRSPSPNSFDRHASVELAHTKAELRKLRNVVEEKDEEMNILRDELEAKEAEVLRLQDERHGLIKDARAAKDLRDELDYVQPKLEKVEKLEAEVSKLKLQLSEIDYYKGRSEQLNEDNLELEDSIRLLESQMEQVKMNVKNHHDVETRLDESQKTVRELQAEIGEKNAKIENFLLEQSKLETQLSNMATKMAEYERLMAKGEKTPRDSIGSLADQMNESDRSEITKLRSENRRLKAQLEGKNDASKDDSILLQSSEVEELRKSVEEKEKEIEEERKSLEREREKTDRASRQLKQLDKTVDSLSEELKESSKQIESLRTERDDAIRNLQEARRKFAQFQTEFGKKLEQETEFKIHEIDSELKEAKRRQAACEEERKEIENQLERVREEQRKLRIYIDEMKEEKIQMELQAAQLERSKKTMENERNMLRERCDKLEDELEEARMRLLNTDDAARRLEERERVMVEQKNRLGDVEAENRTIMQQLELESKKTQRLREDLVTEKAKIAELVGRLRSLCAAVALNGGKIDEDIEDDMKLINKIDDVIMAALNAARREADALRLQQHTQIAELADLKRDIEKLRRSESISLSESDDRVKELSQENVNIKEQVFLLQERVRELQIEVSTKNGEIMTARREIEELHRNSTTAAVSNTELARLQVLVRNSQVQEEHLKQDNLELRAQLDAAEKALVQARKDADSLTTLHQALLANHDRLQNLHNSLSQDFERLEADNREMKGKLRTQRANLVVTPAVSEQENLRGQLAQERTAKEKQLRAYADLHNEHGATKRELESLRKENDTLVRSCERMANEVRQLKLSDVTQRQTIKDLNATVDDLTRELNQKDLEIAKLQNKIEMLTQLNRTYDEESKNLTRQIEMLLAQNKELLNRALSDKDAYHQEQKEFQVFSLSENKIKENFQERLAALRRHKEKLEEKIMDQYRNMENKRSVERQKQPLVKRAAKALINRRRTTTSSQGGSTTEDSSNYSADEGSPTFNHNGKTSDYQNGHLDDFDHLHPTCSSSDDHERTSPKYETIMGQGHESRLSSTLRLRGDPIGGSVRLPNSQNRRPLFHSKTYDHIIISGVERRDQPSLLNSLPPRAPVRNSSVSASMRIRPPPPPYPASKIPNGSNGFPPQKPPAPLPYPGRNGTSNSPTISAINFTPKNTSTPINTPEKPKIYENGHRPVVGEGEERDFIREKDERIDKAMSFYENVHGTHNGQMNGQVNGNGTNGKPNEIWYEYGCV